MKIRKFSLIGISIVMILVLILAGGYKLLELYVRSSLDFIPTPSPLPANVEIVVPESEKLNYWLLSPEGDKIAYVSSSGRYSTDFLLFPAIQKRHKFDGCNIFTWIDNEVFYCSESSILVSDSEGNVDMVPLTRVQAAEVDLDTLLQKAGTIYRFEDSRLNSALWLRDVIDPSNPNKNYLVEGIENIDDVLQGYIPVMISIPRPALTDASMREVYSPNGSYYYRVSSGGDSGETITVYETDNDRKLVAFASNEFEDIILGGWAADSSGVYFQVDSFARFPNPTNLHKILKLKVHK